MIKLCDVQDSGGIWTFDLQKIKGQVIVFLKRRAVLYNLVIIDSTR